MSNNVVYGTFNLEALGISTEELERELAVYCDCEYLESEEGKKDSAIYKPDGKIHLGVKKHGWLCPKCNKFVQIG